HFLTPDFFYGSLSDLSLSADPLTDNRYDLAGGNPISFKEWDGHLVFEDGYGSASDSPRPQATTQIFPSTQPSQTNPRDDRSDKNQNQCLKDISTYVTKCLPQLKLQVKPQFGICLSPKLSQPLLSDCQLAAEVANKVNEAVNGPVSRLFCTFFC